MIELEVVRNKKRLADYYDNYRKFYLQKEYSKASECIWGVINALVYALGLFEGKKIGRHEEVRKFLGILASQYKEIAEGIVPIEQLHANFFHNFMDEDMFKYNVVRAEKLMKKLAELLDHKIKLISSQ